LGHGTLAEKRMDGWFAQISFTLQEKMNFTYDLGKPGDNQWGIEIKSSQGSNWTGMIGQLQNREIDIG